MNALYKTTLLTTMAVVTWKVWKIERNTRKPVINRNDFSKESTTETIERHSDPDSGIKLLKAFSDFTKQAEKQKPTLGEVYRRNKPELPTVTLDENGLFINDFRVPYVLEEGVNVKKSMNNLYKVSLDFFAKSIIADNYEADNPENQQLF
ncbi:TPA: hypothetical protein ACG4K5_000572 [Staphylococcus aureus]